MTFAERLMFLAGLLLGVYGILAAGYQLALWAVRTGRVDLDKMRAKLKG